MRGTYVSGIGIAVLGLSLLSVSCNREGKPKYGDSIGIIGTVTEIQPGTRGRDILLDSGEQLYHIGTTQDGRWRAFMEGDRIVVKGQHGGACEEDFIFAKTFGKSYEKGSIRPPRKVGNVVIPGNMKSKAVVDIIHANAEKYY